MTDIFESTDPYFDFFKPKSISDYEFLLEKKEQSLNVFDLLASAAANVLTTLTTEGDLLTRGVSLLERITRDDLAQDEAFGKRYGYYVNLADPEFGAAMDGVTDDTAAFVAARTAAGSGTIFITGPFRVNSKIALTNTGSGIKALGRFARLILGHANACLEIDSNQSHVSDLRIDGADTATNCLVLTNAAHFSGERLLISDALGSGILLDPEYDSPTGNCNHVNLRRVRSINNGLDGIEVADLSTSTGDSTSLVLDDCDFSDNGRDGGRLRNNLGKVIKGKMTGNAEYGLRFGVAGDTLITDDWEVDNPRLEDNDLGPLHEGAMVTSIINLPDSYTSDPDYEPNLGGNNWLTGYDNSVAGYHLRTHGASGIIGWQFRSNDKSTRLPGELYLANANDTALIAVVTGDPEGAKVARPGSIALVENGSPGGGVFKGKETGGSDTGWVPFIMASHFSDANSMLKADVAGVVDHFTVGTNQLVGRSSSGDITNLNKATVRTILALTTQSANPDTSGATLGDLETEVNQIKAALRATEIIAA